MLSGAGFPDGTSAHPQTVNRPPRRFGLPPVANGIEVRKADYGSLSYKSKATTRWCY